MMFLNLLRKILGRLKVFAATPVITSPQYIDYLRSCGCEIGDNVLFLSPQTTCIDTTRPLLVTIGNNCTFLENFLLLTHDRVSRCFGNVYHEFLPSSGPVTIGNNVYFTRNCTVLKGVTIGDNCIIGFGSVVTKNIPANSVAVGAPARVICTLDEYYEKRKKQSYNEAMNQYNVDKAKYEQEIAAINAKTEELQETDRTLELRLKQLDTEQEALQTELDSVKKVIDKSVDNVFKTFQ